MGGRHLDPLVTQTQLSHWMAIRVSSHAHKMCWCLVVCTLVSALLVLFTDLVLVKRKTEEVYYCDIVVLIVLFDVSDA